MKNHYHFQKLPHKESIKGYNQGEALFVCGSKRMRINIMVTQQELDSFGSGGGL